MAGIFDNLPLAENEKTPYQKELEQKLNNLGLYQIGPTPADVLAARQQEEEGGIEQQDQGGFLNAIGRGLTSGAAGVVQGQAQLGNLFGVGDGQLAQYLQGVNERNARKKEYTIADMIPFATDYWTNPEGMTYDVSNLLGSSGAMMAETGALMTGVGAVGGALGLGGAAAAGGGLAGALSRGASVAPKAVDKFAGWMAGAASKRGYEKLANVLSGPMGRMYALNILKTPIEVSSEAGQAGADALAEGASVGEARIRAGVVAAIQMPLLAMSNTFESANLGSLFAKKTGEKVSKQGIMSILGSITQEGLQNAWEEGMQQSSQEYAADKQSLLGVVNPLQWSEEAQQQAAVGGVGGAVLGLGNAAGGRLIGKKQDEAEAQTEPQPQPKQQATADPTKGARQFLDDLAENAETPEDRKIIGDMADAENPEDVMAAARKFGWKPADEQETVTANSTAEEQQQAATDAVNQTINNMNNAEEDAAEPPSEQPVEQPTDQQGNVGGGRPMDKMSAARQNIPAQLAQNKSTAKYLDKDGNVDTGKLRGSVRLKRFLDETPDALVIGRKALAGDTNAITQFLKYTPAKQAAILDAIDNGADNWKLTDQDKEAIKSYDAKQRAKAVTNLRDAVTKAVNGAGYKPTDKGKALAVAKNGSEQELLDLAKQLKVTIPEIINRVAAPTENVTAKPPKPDKAPAGDGNNNNNNNGNQGDNGNVPIEAKQNLGEYTLSQVIKGKNGGMVFKYRHAGSNGTVALIGRSVKGHYVASIVKKGEKAADKKIAFNSLEEAENYVATYKEPAPANNNNNNGNAGDDNGNVEPPATPPAPATPPTPVTPPAAPATATAAKPTKAKLAIGNSNTMLVKSTESGDYGFKPTAGMSFSKEEMEDLKAAGFKYSPTVGWWRAKDTEAVQKFIDKYKVKETEGGNDNAGNDQNNMGNSGAGTGQQNNGQNPQSGQGQQGQGNNQGQGQNQQTQGLTADERKKLFDKAKAAVNQTTERYANGEISMNEAKADIQKIGEAYFAELKNKKSELSNDAYIDQYRRLVSEPIARLQEIKVKDDNGNNGNIKPPAQEPIVTDYPQYGIKITEVTKRNHNELLYPEAEVAKIRAKNDAAIWGVVQKVLDEFKKDLTIEPKTAKNKLKEIKKAFKTGNKQPPYNYALMDKIDNAINSINTLNTERLKKVKEQIEQEKQQKAQAYTDAVKKCREDADAVIKDFSEKKLDYDAAKAKIQELIDALPKQLSDAGLKALTAKDKASIENKLVALDRVKEKIEDNLKKEVPLAVSDPNDRDAGIELIVTKVINEATPLSEDGKKVYDYFFKIFDEAKHDTGKRRWRKDVAHAAAKLIAFRAETWSKIFNDALGTKYTPLSFAQRYRFYFYDTDYVSEFKKTIGQNTYFVDEDEKGKKTTRPGSDIEIFFSRRASSNTLFHELAHAFMYDLVSIVESGKAPQKLVDDLEKFKQWLWTDADLSDKEKSYYDIQAGTFKEEKLAQALVMHLSDEGMPAGVIGGIYKQLAKVLKFCIEKYQKIIDIVIADEKSTADEVNKAKAYSFKFEIPAEIKSAINDLVLYGREEELAKFEKDNPIKPIAAPEVKTKVTKKEPTFSEQLKAIQDLADEYKNIYDKDGVIDNDKLKEFEKRESAASKLYKGSNTPERKAAIQAALDVLGVKKKLVNYDIEREKANKNIFNNGGNRLDQAIVAADNFENDENLDELEVLNDEIRGIFLDNELLQGHHLDRLVETIFNKKGNHFSEDEYVKALQEIEKIVLQDYTVSKPAEILARVKELGSLGDKANADAFLAAKVYADTILKTLKIGKEVQGLKRDLVKKEKLYRASLLKETMARKKAEQTKEGGPADYYSFDEAADSDLGETLYQAAWHGTPHIFDEFTTDAIGTGEGAQVHGWGLYFAADERVAKGYQYRLTGNNNTPIAKATISFNGETFVMEGNNRSEYMKFEPVADFYSNNPEDIKANAFAQVIENDGDVQAAIARFEQRIKDDKRGLYPSDKIDMEYVQKMVDFLKTIKGTPKIKIEKTPAAGALFKVDIPEDDEMLQEHKEMDEQPEVVKKLLSNFNGNHYGDYNPNLTEAYISESPLFSKPQFSDGLQNAIHAYYDLEHASGNRLYRLSDSLTYAVLGDICEHELQKKLDEEDFDYYYDNDGPIFDSPIQDTIATIIVDIAAMGGERRLTDAEKIIKEVFFSEIEKITGLNAVDFSKKIVEFIENCPLDNHGLNLFDYAKERNWLGRDVYWTLVRDFKTPKNTSLWLLQNGIKGIHYNGNRDGECFVVFDDKAIAIKERYDAVIAKNKETLQRSYDEIVKKLEERFKGCKIEYVGNNDMRVTAPNGISFLVKVKDKIVLNEKQAEKARKAHGISKDKQVYAVGAYTPVFNGEVNGIVKVALNSKKGTETHEITHAAIATSLTDKEYNALMARGEQIAKETGAKANKEELVCNAVQNYVVARENGYVTAFTAEERAELEKTPWGKMLLNLNRAGREAQLFSKLNQEKLSQTAWGKMILAKYKLKRAMAKLFQKVYDFVKNMQAVFQAVDNFHNVARKIEMGEVWKNKKNLRSQKAKYQNAGVKAKTANLDKLSVAEKMEKDGASREEIFDETGWWRAEDGQWRFEIKDDFKNIALAKLAALKIREGVSLEKIYNNPELFKAYPELKNIVVKKSALDIGTRGSYNPETNELELQYNIVDDAVNEPTEGVVVNTPKGKYYITEKDWPLWLIRSDGGESYGAALAVTRINRLVEKEKKLDEILRRIEQIKRRALDRLNKRATEDEKEDIREQLLMYENYKPYLPQYKEEVENIPVPYGLRIELFSTIVHEIQHIVQTIEGHASGGNYFYAKNNALEEEVALKHKIMDDPSYDKDVIEYYKYDWGFTDSETLIYNDWMDHLEKLKSRFNEEQLSQYYEIDRKLQQLYHNKYLDIAGEREARQTGARLINLKHYPWENLDELRTGAPLFIYQDDTKYQIVGEHGASTDQAKLSQAKDMERSGSSKEEIFDATGWWRGADSRWRFEIKDALNGINFKKLSEEPVKLSEIYDNEELYEHYPFLRDVPVKEEAMPGLLGWSNGKEISLAVGLAEEDELSTKKVLLHELQHVIQEHEGFATGGTPSTAVEKAANAYYKMTRVTLPTLYDRIDPKYSYWKTRLNNILAREAAGKPNKTDAAQRPKLEAKIQKANEAYLKNTGDQGTLDKIEQYEANLAQLQWQEKDFEGMVKDYVDMGMPEETARGYIAGHTDRNGVYYEGVASHYYYKALYGEQEARAAETRSDNPSQYPWEDYEGNWNKHPLIIYDTATSASRRGPLDESLADIDAAYKEQLDNALASGANNSELVAIMMAHQDAYFARLNERERERLEKQKLRANELRELRRMFKAGQIDEYTIGGVVIRRNENGEEETVSVTNDFATRKYVNKRGEGKNFANATEALKDAVHSTPTRTFLATAKEWLKDQKDHFYRNWIDKNDDLGIFDKAYMAAMNETIDTVDTVRAKTQMVTNSANGAAFALIDGDEATVKAAQRKYGFKNAISMRMIINKLMEHKATFADYIKKYYSDVAGDQAYIDAFGNYLVAKSLLEASNNHRIDYDKEVAKWKADGSKGSQPIFQEYKFPRGMTEEAVREVVKAAPKGFSALAEMYYKYNENLLDILQASGLISADLHKLLNGKYKAYCPLMRDFTDTAAVEDFVSNISAGKGIANVTDPLQRRRSEGSSRDIVSPLEVTVKSTSAIIARCERNKVGQIFVRRAEEAGMTELCERVQGNAGDAKNCIFTVMFNGEKQAYRTTPELYPAVTHCFEPAIKLQMGFLTAPARLLRAGATMSPSFIIRNFLRDTIFASISSKNGFIPIVDSIRGAYALWQNEQRRAEFDAAGIISSAFYGDDEGVRRSLDEMAGGKFEVHGFLDIIKAIGHYPVQFLKFMSDNIEASTRMGEFMRARQKGKTVDQAAYEAVEITLNFNRSGIEGQQVNRVIPFFNACIQGGDKLYRLFKEDTLGTIGRIGLYIVLPSIVLWALNHDEEWYKELDPNIKATNWLLPGGIRIPKPQEAGILFGTGAEAVLDTAFEQDPKSMSNFINAFKDAMLPNFLPTALLPIIEWQANYSFFRGKPIVNARQQKLPDEMQYGPYTSETAKFVGKYSGLSPVKIDNTVRNIGGTMGMALVQMPDLFAAEKQNLPAKKLSEMFIVRDFLVNDMNKNRTMNDFYSLVDAATKQHAAYGKAGKPTKEVSAINAANGLIAKNRKMIRDITESRKLNSLQKRARIDKIEKDSIRIAKIAIKKYGKNFDY